MTIYSKSEKSKYVIVYVANRKEFAKIIVIIIILFKETHYSVKRFTEELM
ncbi:conserved hypothetical protein [Trichinella spiralis]|nr:conserved hypothetical protein [Trichinella spiralis]